jgi:TolB protein
MKRLTLTVGLLLSIAAVFVAAQNVRIIIEGGARGSIAIPDFRGSGEAEKFMGTFNQVLWDTIRESGLFNMVPKTMYPPNTPQRPQDFRPQSQAPLPGAQAGPASGFFLSSWSGPPVNANYLAFGYAGVSGNQFALFGYLYNITQNDLANAQVLGKLYTGSLDDAGARKVAEEFAADILKQFGQESLAGSKVFFVSDRTGSKEIWMMNHDGTEQQQFTAYRSITTMPSVALEGDKIAFTTFARGLPQIEVFSVEPKRKLPFYNQRASLNATPSFTPDGKQLIFASTAAGEFAQIYISDVDGRNLRRLTSTRAVEVEPKVNPRTGADVVFVSGRSGPQQIYKMNIDGADIARLTTGEGEAANPSWHPNGQLIAFAWTRGFEPGNFNIFVMDVATRQLTQLTHGAGRNENPTWAPDGRHIVFSSRRGRSTQIWTMLADGTQLKQLTTAGTNEKPVWGK